ncbi:MAG TPA: phosphatidylglycerol lysyltransferase domain-containing protein [Candidatus Omnitrophota bacterium]|nr:phosphatidylglycerol lysyltransferase domain-containing protein [Candidatus Omnitrophota bacterium]HPT38840.1 phosphatidylglycerol lysyltransferase domain-containing protein [Candidatus Omnitrophota bacterium]
MKLNKLTLKDQRLFARYLAFSPHELAAFSFANIYFWRVFYNIEWVIIKGCLCIFFRDALGCFMYLPPLSLRVQPEVIPQAFSIMDQFNQNKDISRIENIPQEDLAGYRSLGYLCNEKYPDYLCRRRDLALLKGNKFKSQRAAYNYFTKHYDFAASILKLTDRPGCLDLFDSWILQRKSQCQDTVYCGMLEDNRQLIKEAFANYQKLGLEGIVVKIDKQIKAFSFGYRLNKEIFCILYEITDLTIKGLAQFIFRQFSQELTGYQYINIMDDSGLENLRKTKLAYKPARLVAAYIATRDERKY